MAVVAVAFLAALATSAPDVTVDGAVIRVGDPPVELPAPCSSLGAAYYAERLYIACGPYGLAVVRITMPPAVELLEMRDMGGSVVGFHVAGGTLWVEISRIEARPIAGEAPTSPGGRMPVVAAPLVTGGESSTTAPPAMPPAPYGTSPRTERDILPEPPDGRSSASRAPPPRAAAGSTRERRRRRKRPLGQVLQVDDDGVVVSLGSRDGVRVGNRVRLFEDVERELGAGSVARSQTDIVVGQVTMVTEDRALVALGVNETVPEGVKAQETDRPTTARKVWRARPDGVWSVGLTLRPFIGIGTLAGGMLTEISLAYRLKSPIAFRLVIDPLAFAVGDNPNAFAAPGVFSNGGSLYATYNATFFELGLGGGWSTVNVAGQHLYGAAISQYGRIGTEDGLSLTIRNTFVITDWSFEHGSTSVSGQIGITEKTWLTFTAAGGQSGYVHADGGLRILVDGNGGRGSWYVTPHLGGGGVFRGNGIFVDQVYAGPLVGIGVEWRP